MLELAASKAADPTASDPILQVNPYTVVGILDTVQQLGATGLVHTAAASQVGQMLVKLAQQRGVTLLNVVRRADQARG